MNKLDKKNRTNTNKMVNPSMQETRVSNGAGSTMTKSEQWQHKDEQRLDALISKSNKGEFVVIDVNHGVRSLFIGGQFLLIDILRRLFKRGTLKGFRLDKWTMHSIKRDCRTFRGERSEPEYWVNRGLRVLEANGCASVNGDTVAITPKGKAWLFEATVKNSSDCGMGKHGYDYLHKLARDWKTEMETRKPCTVSSFVLHWATRAWGE